MYKNKNTIKKYFVNFVKDYKNAPTLTYKKLHLLKNIII